MLGLEGPNTDRGSPTLLPICSPQLEYRAGDVCAVIAILNVLQVINAVCQVPHCPGFGEFYQPGKQKAAGRSLPTAISQPLEKERGCAGCVEHCLPRDVRKGKNNR